jgi:hypothetical protein
MVRGRPREPGKRRRQRQKAPPARRRLSSLEELENRVLLTPTSHLVDLTGNTTSGSTDSGTLPYVLGLANANNNPAGSRITFDSTVFNGGGVYVASGSLTIHGGSLTDNSASIGSGGSGGLVNRGNDNTVGVADPKLAPLADYGGLTQTIALLPGSPAIDAGSAAWAPTVDQRGISGPQGSSPDIGAFESRGFTITVTGGNGQSTLVNTAVAQPLQVTVASAFNEPVAGGVVTFTVPGSGASASLSSGTATIGAGGVTSVTANADGQAGTYSITASASGVATAISFTLTNAYQPAFVRLTGQLITYGTTSVIFTGTLAGNLQVPTGDDVTVAVNGIAQQARIGNAGSFSSIFAGAGLEVSSSPYTVSYDFSPQGLFLGTEGTSQLTVNPAQLTITAVDLTKSYGQT